MRCRRRLPSSPSSREAFLGGKHSTRNIRELALNSLAATFTTNPKKTDSENVVLHKRKLCGERRTRNSSVPSSFSQAAALSPSLPLPFPRRQKPISRRKTEEEGERNEDRALMFKHRWKAIAQDDSGSEGKCEARGRMESRCKMHCSPPQRLSVP